MSKKRMFAEIAKVEAQDDGTIKVWGYASTGAVDSDGETVTPDAMKAALPDYMKFGAVREMHQPLAAGTAIEAEVQDDGKTWFGAHVVDPVAVTKVQTGVYKGFSIGGKVTERDPLDKKVIKGLNLVEVSLVDRPANPEAVISIFKAARTPEEDVNELAELLDSGEVTPAYVLELVKAAQVAGRALTTAALQAENGAAGQPESPQASSDDAARGQGSPEGQDGLRKGMYSVSEFASVLNSISYLASDAGWESQYEGDNSPIPAAMLKWLQDGIEIFKAMAAEETAEMVANLRAAANLPEVIEMSDSVAAKAAKAGGDVLAKAGARFSKDTKDALSKIHAACKEASDHLDKLGYMDDSDDAGKAAAVDPATPAPEGGAVTKAQGDGHSVEETIAKAIAPLQDQLTKVTKENGELRGQLEEIKKRAAPGRALLKAMTKASDASTDTDPAADEPLAPEGTPERAEQEMRKVFKTGGRRLVG